MAKLKVNLRSMDLRGETITTRWGDVMFDKDGLSTLEVDDGDLPLLRNLKWIHEPAGALRHAPDPLEEPPMPTFDTSDSEVPHDPKKASKSRR